MDLIVSVQDVTDYLGIEFAEADLVIHNIIKRQISAADSYLRGAIGKDYDTEDPRAKELAVMIAAELYNTRGLTSARQEASVRRIAADFIRQMKLEGRGDQ